jgi:hypothetical protein
MSANRLVAVGASVCPALAVWRGQASGAESTPVLRASSDPRSRFVTCGGQEIADICHRSSGGFQSGRRPAARLVTTGIRSCGVPGLVDAGGGQVGLRMSVRVRTFLNRADDQLLLDVALHQLPVTLVLGRAGITGPDGPSHHGMWDLALLAGVPGMRVACPRDPARLWKLLREAVAVDGPAAVRFPKATAGPDLSALARMDGVDILHRSPHSPLDVLIVAIGALAPACLDAHRVRAVRRPRVTAGQPRPVRFRDHRDLPAPATAHRFARVRGEHAMTHRPASSNCPCRPRAPTRTALGSCGPVEPAARSSWAKATGRSSSAAHRSRCSRRPPPQPLTSTPHCGRSPS